MQVLEKILEEIELFKKKSFDPVKPMRSDKLGTWVCDRIADIIRSHMEDDGWIPADQPPEDDGWIPVSSGILPPDKAINPITMDFEEYEVTFKSDNVHDIRHYKFGNGHWWHGPAIVDKYVTAWRQRPKPYQPKEED